MWSWCRDKCPVPSCECMAERLTIQEVFIRPQAQGPACEQVACEAAHGPTRQRLERPLAPYGAELLASSSETRLDAMEELGRAGGQGSCLLVAGKGGAFAHSLQRLCREPPTGCMGLHRVVKRNASRIARCIWCSGGNVTAGTAPGRERSGQRSTVPWRMHGLNANVLPACARQPPAAMGAHSARRRAACKGVAVVEGPDASDCAQGLFAADAAGLVPLQMACGAPSSRVSEHCM